MSHVWPFQSRYSRTRCGWCRWQEGPDQFRKQRHCCVCKVHGDATEIKKKMEMTGRYQHLVSGQCNGCSEKRTWLTAVTSPLPQTEINHASASDALCKTALSSAAEVDLFKSLKQVTQPFFSLVPVCLARTYAVFAFFFLSAVFLHHCRTELKNIF